MASFLFVLLVPALLGAGSESKFAQVEGWPKVPAGWSFTMVSNISGDSRGRIYVASRGDHPIAIFEPDGKLVGTMGENDIPPTMNYDITVSPPKPISVKRWVHGLHVDSSDNVWVTDLARHIVLKFSPQGKLLLTLGTPGQSGESPKHFFQPSSVAVGRNGDVFVADGYGNSRIVKFSPDGKYVRAWGKKGSAPGEFDTPHCVALDASGRVYIAERMNNRVSVFDGDGRFLAQWTGLERADAVTVRDSFVYVGTGREKRLIRFSLDGKNLGDVVPAASLGYTHGIYIDRGGNIYVADPIADDAHKPPIKAAPRGR